jgi:hypothetical protein
MGQQALMQESILCLEVKQELEQMEQVDKEVPAAAAVEDKMARLLLQVPETVVPAVAVAVREQQGVPVALAAGVYLVFIPHHLLLVQI